MINQDSFKRAKAVSEAAVTIKPKKLLKRINAALAEAEPKGQYSAIKDMIDNRAVAALKKHFDIEEYVSVHRMRWDLINAFNQEDEE